MFLSEVRSAKADKILAKRSADRRIQMAITYIPYSDQRLWGRAEWLFMLDNSRLKSPNGFYISADLFKVSRVPKGKKASESSKSTSAA